MQHLIKSALVSKKELQGFKISESIHVEWIKHCPNIIASSWYSGTVQLRWFFIDPPKPVGHKIEWGGLKFNDHR